jgi:integrase
VGCDIQFGADDTKADRFVEVKRNYVYGRFTSPKNHRSRRVDLSAELRRTLLDLQDERLLKAFSAGKSTIVQDFIFPSKTGGVLDPDNMIRDRFLPLLRAAGIRAIRFHDLRHTFGAMLIAAGAPVLHGALLTSGPASTAATGSSCRFAWGTRRKSKKRW